MPTPCTHLRLRGDIRTVQDVACTGLLDRDIVTTRQASGTVAMPITCHRHIQHMHRKPAQCTFLSTSAVRLCMSSALVRSSLMDQRCAAGCTSPTIQEATGSGAAATGLPLRGAKVLELGAGVGLPALVAAACGATALLTDCLPSALNLACRNVSANAHLMHATKGTVKVGSAATPTRCVRRHRDIWAALPCQLDSAGNSATDLSQDGKYAMHLCRAFA